MSMIDRGLILSNYLGNSFLQTEQPPKSEFPSHSSLGGSHNIYHNITIYRVGSAQVPNRNLRILRGSGAGQVAADGAGLGAAQHQPPPGLL